MKETLYIYVRVSSEKQVGEDKFSLQVQKEAGIRKAQSMGFRYQIFEDAGKSARYENIDNRPELQKLISLCEQGSVKSIYVYDQSRLSRNKVAYNQLAMVFKKHRILLITENQITDFNNYTSVFSADILNAVAMYENEQRATKSKEARLLAVRKGKFHGGNLAFGYTVDKENNLIIDEDEKKIYLKIVDLLFSGHGTNTIARMLNEEGIPTKGKKDYKNGIHYRAKFTNELKYKRNEDLIWKGGTILCILKNSLYKGERKYTGEIISAPAIVTEEVWANIQQKLLENKNKSKRNNKVNFFLLRGFLECAKCGNNFYGVIKEKKGMRVYSCMSKRPNPHPRFCGMKSINIDFLNNLVWHQVCEILINSYLIKEEFKKLFSDSDVNIDSITKEIASLKREIKKVDEERQNYIRIAGRGIISDDELTEQLNFLSNRKNSSLNEISVKEHQLQISKDQQNAYNWILRSGELLKNIITTDDDQLKRSVLEMYVNRIYIDYNETKKEHTMKLELKIPLMNDSKYYTEDEMDELDNISLYLIKQSENPENVSSGLIVHSSSR